jgi:hypothetical protein
LLIDSIWQLRACKGAAFCAAGFGSAIRAGADKATQTQLLR